MLTFNQPPLAVHDAHVVRDISNRQYVFPAIGSSGWPRFDRELFRSQQVFAQGLEGLRVDCSEIVLHFRPLVEDNTNFVGPSSSPCARFATSNCCRSVSSLRLVE